MKIKSLFNILSSYGYWLPQILFFEIYYLLKGYKRNSVKVLNTDIKSFVDLGCADGRSIFFFNKQLKINFNGIEYDPYVYGNCKKLFNKYDNIKINHDDIMSFKFLEYNNDCFFIGDPLKKNMILINLFKKFLKRI